MKYTYPLDIAEDLIYTNNPSNIIVMDSRNHTIGVDALDRIHRSIGLKMIAYHYFITLSGTVYGCRPERALNPDLLKLTRATYSRMLREGVSPLDDIDAEMEDRSSSISSNKIIICLEGNTSSRSIPVNQMNSLIKLGKDIMSRNRNIKDVFSLNELLPMYNNLGENVDFADIRARIKSVISPMSVITPAGTVTYKFGGRVLKYVPDNNMSGNDIKLLEIYLTRLGFEVPHSNGVYDLFTINAVRAFQKKFKLPITGEFHSEDFDIINSEINKLRFIDTSKNKYHRVIRYREDNEMYGDDIEILNERLQKIYPLENFTNTFNLVSKNAVELFQEKNKIDVDGVVGPITWKMIFDYNYVRFIETIIYDPEGNNEYSDVIKMIQEKIRKNANRFTISEMSHNGFYDVVTYNNIRKIKSIINMPLNGNIDEDTFNFFNSL